MSPADWEAIERDYRAGVLSVREIARQHAVSHTAINKRAKENGWKRDLTEKVREATRTSLSVSTEVSTSNASGKSERKLVEDAAALCVELVRGHRGDLRGLRQTAEVLMGQLQVCSENRDLLEDLVMEVTSEDATTKRRAALMKAVSLATHAGVLRDLSVVFKNAIPLERQAFNIDAMPPPEKPRESPLDPVRLQRLDERFARFRTPVTIEQ